MLILKVHSSLTMFRPSLYFVPSCLASSHCSPQLNTNEFNAGNVRVSHCNVSLSQKLLNHQRWSSLHKLKFIHCLTLSATVLFISELICNLLLSPYSTCFTRCTAVISVVPYGNRLCYNLKINGSIGGLCQQSTALEPVGWRLWRYCTTRSGLFRVRLVTGISSEPF
jgi:hypothetical protein